MNEEHETIQQQCEAVIHNETKDASRTQGEAHSAGDLIGDLKSSGLADRETGRAGSDAIDSPTTGNHSPANGDASLSEGAKPDDARSDTLGGNTDRPVTHRETSGEHNSETSLAEDRSHPLPADSRPPADARSPSDPSSDAVPKTSPEPSPLATPEPISEPTPRPERPQQEFECKSVSETLVLGGAGTEAIMLCTGSDGVIHRYDTVGHGVGFPGGATFGHSEGTVHMPDATSLDGTTADCVDVGVAVGGGLHYQRCVSDNPDIDLGSEGGYLAGLGASVSVVRAEYDYQGAYTSPLDAIVKRDRLQ